MKSKQQPQRSRGVFERPKGSGIWWINYYVQRKQKREKVGSRSSALALYKARKTDAWRGIKLPELRTAKLTLSALIDDALVFANAHNQSARDYECKARIVRKAMGSYIASEVTPQDIDAWLSKRKSNATANRYKAFFSLVYREGVRNGKVQINPARQIRQRKEGTGRLRFLSRAEYEELCSVIRDRFPHHLPAFVVSVHTGMRLSEQFSCLWTQVDLGRQIIDLTKTKNGSARVVRLNATALTAIASLRRPGQPRNTRVFPHVRSKRSFDTRSWFKPCLAAAKITGYVWHCNRHTFCSWLAMSGASIKEIQEAAGHKTITMTARYSHLSPAHLQSVVERIVTPDS
jgi:integrase